MTAGHSGAPFASATLDELWVGGRLIERRLSHGQAFASETGIVATDVRDDALVSACTAEMERLHAHVLPDARVRLVAEATLEEVSGTMTVSLGGHSIVTSPEHLENDLVLLRGACVSPKISAVELPADVPFVWRNGTAAVLLHEALGHAREHRHPELIWPEWLSVDLPMKPRRATFRDVPLVRMTSLIARQTNAPFSLDESRVEVLLIDGGAYDPLTELVTVRIAAADLIVEGHTQRIEPFEIARSRRDVASSFLGATGNSIRYPGVICSREGQELVVGTCAPVMVTR